MLSARKNPLSGPTSDKTDSPHYSKLKALFAKALGDPKDSKSVQAVLLKQISSFHEYYSGRIADLKQQVEKMHSNMKELERECRDSSRALCERETQLQMVNRENQELMRLVESGRHNSRNRNSDKSYTSEIHSFYQTLNESFKDKLKVLEGNFTVEMDNVNAKCAELVREKSDLQKQVDKLANQNASMRLQIKEYEVEKRYEADRIKNATLELEIKLRHQDDLLSKMGNVSRELYIRNNTCRLSDIEKRDTMNDSAGGGILISDPNCDSVLNGSLVQQFKVTRKIGNCLGQWSQNQRPIPTEKNKQSVKKGKLSHKRNLSHQTGESPRQEESGLKTSRDPKHKGNSELKIKVMRLQKMRRK